MSDMCAQNVRPTPEPSAEYALREVTLVACDACLGGAGGQCHTPGCAFWMSAAPDVPLARIDGGVCGTDPHITT